MLSDTLFPEYGAGLGIKTMRYAAVADDEEVLSLLETGRTGGKLSLSDKRGKVGKLSLSGKGRKSGKRSLSQALRFLTTLLDGTVVPVSTPGLEASRTLPHGKWCLILVKQRFQIEQPLLKRLHWGNMAPQ